MLSLLIESTSIYKLILKKNRRKRNFQKLISRYQGGWVLNKLTNRSVKNFDI